MANDNNKLVVLDFLGDMLNIEYEFTTIARKAYHIPFVDDIPDEYATYKIRDFLLLYRIDCLFEKGLITENDKKNLLSLFNHYLSLRELLYKQIALEAKLKDDMVEVSIPKAKQLERQLAKTTKKKQEIEDEVDRIELIFEHYHLYDEINLADCIKNSVQVENTDFDLDSAATDIIASSKLVPRKKD